MKVTIVPAQVTTVEDRIMGNLSMTQMLFLIAPVFAGAGIFVGLPPWMEGAVYKYVLLGVIAVLGSVLAIRVRGIIVARWLVVILRFSQRPRIYAYTKNTSAFRPAYHGRKDAVSPLAVPVTAPLIEYTTPLAVSDELNIRRVMEEVGAKLRFETSRKGALYVRLAEDGE